MFPVSILPLSSHSIDTFHRVFLRPFKKLFLVLSNFYQKLISRASDQRFTLIYFDLFHRNFSSLIVIHILICSYWTCYGNYETNDWCHLALKLKQMRKTNVHRWLSTPSVSYLRTYRITPTCPMYPIEPPLEENKHNHASSRVRNRFDFDFFVT